MAQEKNPFQMNLLVAAKTKLYNQGAFWAFNLAKYRALLSNDPALIKQFYKVDAALFDHDVYSVSEISRSFYYGDEFVENAEEYFGLIPMVCESIAKLVCGSGYEFSETIPDELKERLKAILEDNDFDNDILKTSIIESIGLGDAAWHVHFDPELSDYPIIELVPAERLAIEKKYNRIVKYTIKQQVILDNEPKPYELHTIYTRRRTRRDVRGVERYYDDGIVQEFKVWNGTDYVENDRKLTDEIFKAYGIQGRTILPLVDFPVIYLPNTLNNTKGVETSFSRPCGVVFGLESNSAALDEILSNCVDTVRKCFPFLLVDEQMIPSDISGDKDKGAFSTRRHHFVLPKNCKEPEKLMQMIQAKLNTTEYVEAAKFQINIALNKVGLNAATLGLQLTGHVEAESTQNAKERNSIRTRNTLAADFERYLSKLFAVLLQYEDYINGNTIAVDVETGQEATVVEEYKGLGAVFKKYIVDTPEEVVDVLAKKVQSNLMSIFAAVREQHPDWDEDTIYKETNLIYAEKGGGAMQVVNPEKPASDSVVLAQGEEPTEDEEAQEKGLQGAEEEGGDNE